MGLEVIPPSVRVVVIAPTASFHCSRLRRVHCSLVHVSQRFFRKTSKLAVFNSYGCFRCCLSPCPGAAQARMKKEKSNILAHFQAVFTVPLINRSSKLVASRSIVVFQWVRDMSCCICKAHRNFPLPQAFELVPKDHALYERRGKSALHKLSHHRRLHRIIPE